MKAVQEPSSRRLMGSPCAFTRVKISDDFKRILETETAGLNSCGKRPCEDVPSALRMLVTNIRGFKQGCGELARVTVDTRAHIVCVTESHLDRDDSIDDISIPEGYYVAARKDRTANGGGVLIIAQQSLMGSEFDVSNFYLPEKSEMVAFSLQEYVIVCCYTQPSQSDYTLVSQMSC